MRRLISTAFVAAALALTVAGSAAFPVAQGAGQAGDPVVAAAGGGGRGRGNGFVRALKAPFKAIGRLFGGRKDGSRPERLSEKDVKRFETAPVLRTVDAMNPAPAPAEPGDSLDGLLAEGRAALAQGRINEAVFSLSRAVSLGPERWEPYHLLGVAYFRKGFPEQSRLSFEQALRYGGQNFYTLNDYGYALLRFGDYKGAVKQLRRAAKLAPDNARTWNNLAVAQSRLREYDEAFKSLSRAGGEYYAHLNIASMLTKAGRDAAAVTHYEAARRLDPNSREVLQQLSDLYRRLGRVGEAEVALRELGEAERSQPAKGQ